MLCNGEILATVAEGQQDSGVAYTNSIIALTTMWLWLLLLVSSACARGNGSSHYISLDVYSGTGQEPCTNDFDGWSPSLDALKDPNRCYGTYGDDNITCISRRMHRLDDDERMISTAPMRCAVNGFQDRSCGGANYWPAQFNLRDQTWTWAWDRGIEKLDVGSFRILCQ